MSYDSPEQRRIARRNGWLICVLITPIMFAGTLLWFLEEPGVVRFIVGLILLPAIPIVFGVMAIRWGSGQPPPRDDDDWGDDDWDDDEEDAPGQQRDESRR